MPQRSLGIPLLPKTPDISLDAAGLVALADLTTIQRRTVLTGTTSLLDALILCPGMHMQQSSTNLNGGEYPACGALTTGFVFRVENPGTVYYLQQISKTGHLTNLTVSKIDRSDDKSPWYAKAASFSFPPNTSYLPALAYGTAVLWNLAVILLMGFSHDWWGLAVVLILVASRLCNVIVIRRRAKQGWSGAPEPGVQGDLLVLLSQDRWVRIKGEVDHLKAVTSGQWLRDQNMVESWATALATFVVYLAAALVSNATQFGKILVLVLLGGSVGFLAVANSLTKFLMMHDYIIKPTGESRKYARRLDLANELVRETGREDWAVRMGMISGKTCEQEPVVM